MDTKQAEQLANDLIKQFLPSSWRFQWNHCKVIFGRCNLSRQIILMSKPMVVLNDEVVVKDTILHEIAHALAPIGSGHERVWKRMAIVVGCRPERCYDSKTVKSVEGKYNYECPVCKQRVSYHRKPRATRSCGICDHRFNPKYILEPVKDK